MKAIGKSGSASKQLETDFQWWNLHQLWVQAERRIISSCRSTIEEKCLWTQADTWKSEITGSYPQVANNFGKDWAYTQIEGISATQLILQNKPFCLWPLTLNQLELSNSFLSNIEKGKKLLHLEVTRLCKCYMNQDEILTKNLTLGTHKYI